MAIDPHHRATPLHNCPICAGGGLEYRDQPWYGFVTLEEGHNQVDKSSDNRQEQHQKTPAGWHSKAKRGSRASTGTGATRDGMLGVLLRAGLTLLIQEG